MTSHAGEYEKDYETIKRDRSMNSMKTSIYAPFALLGHRGRINIILSLKNSSLSFEELFRKSQIDDRGKFGYHLRKLLGRFVAKNRSGEYVLNDNGKHALRVILAQSEIEEPQFTCNFEDIRCPFCKKWGAKMQIRSKFVSIKCTTCTIPLFAFPLMATEWKKFRFNSGRVLDFVFTEHRSSVLIFKSGFCSICKGASITKVEWDEGYLVKRYLCSKCGCSIELLGEIDLVDDWRVLKFLEENGQKLDAKTSLNILELASQPENQQYYTLKYRIKNHILKLKVTKDLSTVLESREERI